MAKQVIKVRRAIFFFLFLLIFSSSFSVFFWGGSAPLCEMCFTKTYFLSWFEVIEKHYQYTEHLRESNDKGVNGNYRVGRFSIM